VFGRARIDTGGEVPIIGGAAVFGRIAISGVSILNLQVGDFDITGFG
jgi:hypothetical protein